MGVGVGEGNHRSKHPPQQGSKHPMQRAQEPGHLLKAVGEALKAQRCTGISARPGTGHSQTKPYLCSKDWKFKHARG